MRSKKSVLITGVTEGLGQALGEKFVDEGWFVVGCSRSAETKVTEEELIESVDVSKPGEVKDFAERVQTRCGTLDLIINNASILGQRAAIEDYPIAEWQRVIDINLSGSFYVAKYFLPMLTAGGKLLNISSGAGVRGGAAWGAYAASKFAIEGLSQVLAAEMMERGVRVHSVDPGAMRTSMRAAAFPDEDPNALPTPASIAARIFRIAVSNSPINSVRIIAKE